MILREDKLTVKVNSLIPTLILLTKKMGRPEDETFLNQPHHRPWLRRAGGDGKRPHPGRRRPVGNTGAGGRPHPPGFRRLAAPLIKDPSLVAEADYVLVESTYGDRLHTKEKPDYVGSLAKIIKETFDRGGNVVIPSFAVGRTQEMLYFIRQIKERDMIPEHRDFPVYVDSPLAVEATGIFNKKWRSSKFSATY